MSLEAWGDEGPNDNGYSEDRMAGIGLACFAKGAQVCREMLARCVEQGGDHTIAGSIRANWNPAWGDDPGRISDAEYDELRTGLDPMSIA